MEFSASPGSGKRIVLMSKGLPKPFATESARNGPKVIPQPSGAKLELPPGFELTVFSEGGYNNPRWIKEGPNGDLFLADEREKTIYLLRDANKDGQIDNATERFTFATGLNRPFGMAVQKIGAQTWFYIENTDAVVRFKYTPGQTKVEGEAEKLLEVPTRGHWTRDILRVSEGIAEQAQKIKVGSGLDPASDMGPLVSDKQLNRVCGYLESGVAEGARTLAGGKKVGDAGYFDAGLKLKLSQWARLSLEDRFLLTEAPCNTAGEVNAYRLLLSDLVRERTGESLSSLPAGYDSDWKSESVPERVLARAGEIGVTITRDQWAALHPPPAIRAGEARSPRTRGPQLQARAGGVRTALDVLLAYTIGMEWTGRGFEMMKGAIATHRTK